MAKEGGEQSPAWAPRGSRPVGGVARIPQPCPQGADHSPISRRTYWVGSGRVRCVPRGVEQSSSLGKPWQGPERPSVPGLARQEQVGTRGSLAAPPPGSKRLIHPITSCGPMSRS